VKVGGRRMMGGSDICMDQLGGRVGVD
jgi:hypothetical protein